LKAGDLVVSPFTWPDNTCDFCAEGLQTSCRHGGFWAANGIDGCQGEAARVGAPQYPDVPMDFGVFLRNVTLTGGVATARAYIEELLPDVLDGTVQPGRVFDRTVSLDEVPDGYRAMADRKALKVLVQP
jgi:threonine dehydrogenase-like Zn-dependent dehydrogenase